MDERELESWYDLQVEFLTQKYREKKFSKKTYQKKLRQLNDKYNRQAAKIIKSGVKRYLLSHRFWIFRDNFKKICRDIKEKLRQIFL